MSASCVEVTDNNINKCVGILLCFGFSNSSPTYCRPIFFFFFFSDEVCEKEVEVDGEAATITLIDTWDFEVSFSLFI